MEPQITLALREEARLNGEASALAVEPAGRRTGTVAPTGLFTPLVLGRRLTLNPLVILLWLSLWLWLRGIPGALLAVPMLKTLKIFCDNIPSLAPMGEFLGS